MLLSGLNCEDIFYVAIWFDIFDNKHISVRERTEINQKLFGFSRIESENKRSWLQYCIFEKSVKTSEDL